MKLLWITFAVTVTLAALAAGVAARDRTIDAGVMVAYSERPDRDVQIKVWHEALAADDHSALALGQLAALHLQRAREGGTWDDYVAAESFARRSLALRTQHNGATAATLANVLIAQHRFVEAQVVAAQLVRREPDIPQYRALLGEISMELGDDKTAAWMFDSLWTQRTHLSIAPRLARWAELNGRLPLARELIERARDEARRRHDVPRETRAWFELREGDLAMRMGRVRAAEASYRSGLVVEPNDPRLLLALARLHAVRGRPGRAIELAERALALQFSPDVLGVIADAHTALGDTAKAAEFYTAMEVAVTQQPGPFHRSWALSLLDRGVSVPEILERARAEYTGRKDVHGCDLLAWAFYKAGRLDDASAPMREALRLNTPDATLWYHDGMIALSLGDRAHARASLQRALDINPYFHSFAPARVRAVLDSLKE